MEWEIVLVIRLRLGEGTVMAYDERFDPAWDDGVALEVGVKVS